MGKNSLKALGLSLFLLASACDVTGIIDVDNTDFVATENFSFTFDATESTRFRLAGINGRVQVAGDPNATTVRVTGQRKVGSSSVSDAEAHLPDLRVIVEETSSEIYVYTDQPENPRGRNYTVDYVVTVPNGMVQSIGNVNGNVSVVGVAANVGVGNVNGNIDIAGVTGDLAVGLVNGNITADVTLPVGDGIAMATVNGNLTLTVQEDVSARFEAGWVNGGFSITGLTLTDQEATQTSIRGTLGSGAGAIEMGLTNGQIAVRGRS